ncbi:hydratase [Leptolyngbyaceae cyanobacterium CCMR0082]|uniref:Hydratase n=1 Tax=Adonisia turfae CCMR0082 TaxID=2304604 RepID=A0A6M0S3K4_9CYAN|nr:hydratase [Adonisia turfae]NEZ63084.1 hydratase [Adonisia turfae CCMR0082]
MKNWRWLKGIGLGIFMAGGATAIHAAEPLPQPLQPLRLAQSYTDLVAVSLFQHYSAGYPAPILTEGLSSRQIDSIHLSFVRRLIGDAGDEGSVVGYKVALTNTKAQSQLGISHPLYGFLLENMLLEDGATLPLEFGSRPQAEGDLMVRVGSADINQADTDLELLAGLDAVIPFLELPDLVYEEDAVVNAGALVAVNVGARYGVMGNPVELESGDSGLDQLANIRVVLNNDRGQFLVDGESSALLGHPINSVRWLRDTLLTQGVELRPGDLLSLGSVTSLVSLDAGTDIMGIEARYFGLRDNERSVDLEVSFEVDDD